MDKVSILILVKNESKNIGTVLQGIKGKLSSLDFEYEFVIVDGNSTDGTYNEVKAELRESDILFIQEKEGYANGLIEGIERCSGDYIMTLDGDCSHSVEYVDGLLAKMPENDLVIGSRFVKGGYGKFSFRHFLSIILNGVFSTILGIPVKDMSSGFRLYKRDLLLRVIHDEPVVSRHFEVLIEIVTKIFLSGGRIAESPICYKERRSGTSKVILYKWGNAYLKLLVYLILKKYSIRNSC